MATYRMEDGSILKTENAVKSWDEDTWWNGHNHISKATETQWDHQRLHKSRKGRYWLECWSQMQGVKNRAEWQSPEDATRWLLLNDHELPEDLAHLQEEVEE